MVSDYRQQRDAEWLYAVLHEDVKAGDSIERVQELLGKGQAADEPDRLLEATRKLAEMHPVGYPDGVQEGDVFLGYPIGKRSILYLQFRNGKLVNHIPDHFAEYEPATVLQ